MVFAGDQYRFLVRAVRVSGKVTSEDVSCDCWFVDNLYSSGTFFLMEIEIIGWL